MDTASRIRASWLVVATLLVLLVLPALALAAEFSADMVQTAGGQTVTGKIYVKGANLRQDVKMQGMSMTTIVRGDKKVLWMLHPEQKTYMEMDLKSMPDGADIRKHLQMEGIVQSMGGKDAVTQKSLGTDKVNGYLCDKYLVTPKKKTPGSAPMTFWISKKLGIPLRVKSQGEGGMTMDFKNVREGKVANSVFDLPKGYKKTTMPAMGGGRRGGPGRGGPGGPGGSPTR